jgi:4-methyl-5(b-hydroxyethyl)-thiazole monophosphate biosynthesis
MLPGGMPGTKNLQASKIVKAAIKNAAQKNAPIAAICAAPSILGSMGLLSGKRATCFPGFEGQLEGAILSEQKVVRDGNIITAAGMGVALEFGLAIIEMLLGADRAEQLARDVLAK